MLVEYRFLLTLLYLMGVSYLADFFFIVHHLTTMLMPTQINGTQLCLLQVPQFGRKWLVNEAEAL